MPFGASAVTVCIGNAEQTIPAFRFEEKKGKFTYKDKKGVNGFILPTVFQ